MSNRKLYRTIAMQGRSMLMDVTVGTRAAEKLAHQEAISVLDRMGGGVMLQQTVGAPSWGAWLVKQDAGAAYRMSRDDAAPFISTMLHFLETGGTYAE